MVSIQKFWIIVLVSNPIEYWSNYLIQNFEYSHNTTQNQVFRLTIKIHIGVVVLSVCPSVYLQYCQNS